MSAANNTRTAPARQGKNIPVINSPKAQPRAYIVRDGYGGASVVFATSGAAARRIGASDLNIGFEDVDSCRRARNFDGFSSDGFVPVQELISAGWRYECLGCGHWVDADLEGEGADGEFVRLNPVYEDHGVWCSPECRSSTLQDRLICAEKQASAIKDFQRRVLKRFPGVRFTGQQYARVVKSGGRYAVESVIVSFSFPGQRIAPASYRYDLYDRSRGTARHGPPDPHYECCAGDVDAFEAFSHEVRS